MIRWTLFFCFMISTAASTAFAANNYRERSPQDEAMTAVADVYGERLTEEKVLELGHEKSIQQIRVKDLPESVTDAAAEFFLLLETEGVTVNAMEYARVRRVPGLSSVKPDVISDEDPNTKIFQVQKGQTVVGYTIERPAKARRGVLPASPAKSLYFTIQGTFIREGLTNMVSHNKKNKVRKPFTLDDLDQLLSTDVVKSPQLCIEFLK